VEDMCDFLQRDLIPQSCRYGRWVVRLIDIDLVGVGWEETLFV
jgi:hypothetical protein